MMRKDTLDVRHMEEGATWLAEAGNIICIWVKFLIGS